MAESHSIDICIDLLLQANSDNEKLAALILVPKVLSRSRLHSYSQSYSESNTGCSDNSNHAISHQSVSSKVADSEKKACNESGDSSSASFTVEEKRRVLDAIGVQFLRRLLFTGSNEVEKLENLSLTEDQISLKTVGLSVASCFTEDGILTKEELSTVLNCLESILLMCESTSNENGTNTISTGSKDAPPADQSFKQLQCSCLEVYESLIRDQTLDTSDQLILPTLYRVGMKQQSTEPLLCQISSLISKLVLANGIKQFSISSQIAICALNLHQIKVSEPNNIDFSLCSSTWKMMQDLDMRTPPVKLHPLFDSVIGKLYDVIKNKLPADKRQSVLKLLTMLVQLRGIKALIQERSSKGALLLIHLCSIEVRMTLEQDKLAEIADDSEMLCCCFFALEQMIFYMAHNEATLQLDSREVLQVHSALQGAISAIIYFLSNYADDADKTTQPDSDDTLVGIVAACIRLLGAWTAEETESLIHSYTSLLPALLPICEYLLDTVDSMKFLIPGLSNFTTDTELIVEALLPQLDFLMVYITHCTKQLLNHKEEYEHVLINTCVVVLNCVMMPQVTHDAAALAKAIDCISSQSLSLISVCQNVDCSITMIVCGLTMLRKVHELNTSQSEPVDAGNHQEFYRQSVAYLLNLTKHRNKEGAVLSADVPEIWLLGIQVMGDLMKTSIELRKILTEPDHIRTALELFEKHSTNVDVVFVLERLLISMAEHSGAEDLIVKVNKAKKK